MFCIADCVGDSVNIAVPQPSEWQRIGNQIDAAFVFALADFVEVHLALRTPRFSDRLSRLGLFPRPLPLIRHQSEQGQREQQKCCTLIRYGNVSRCHS